ncbi:uncharacterized protein IUM83_06598 [Phytophthora cinnamomi]|uniref:uncharacterized protein n=1 Tax=Phytophthora cinnamomi TaxID=4785 RepID=UPI002A289B76|nr:hypothetical protein IUM83_06598 [Phytophthora cinnamomi]KAJ8525106.1 hypothetical protein ON010_g16008 [Phytophthora cinnamomi]
MLSRRLLSTKVSKPLQHATKAAKTATSRQDATAQAAESADANPWGHFAAFSSMEDYVDMTLIQYNNNNNNNSNTNNNSSNNNNKDQDDDKNK